MKTENNPTVEPAALEKEIAEGGKRELKGWQYWVVAGIALAASLFHLYTAAFGLLSAMYQRGVHWMFMGSLIFLIYPATKKRPRDRIDPWDWVLAAALPATLYFISIVAMVHFRAGRRKIKSLTADTAPRIGKVLKEGWHLLLPIFTLVAFLALGYSAVKAVFWSIIIMICIGVIGITGVGLAFSSFVINLSGGVLPLALILTMIGSIILGMGVPTTAQYIITSTLAAPALYQMGVPLMSAHLFCQYFGVLADVTPPVALATYAAAGIAKSNAIKTGFTALLTATAGFLVPYMFVYNNHLLFQGNLLQIAYSFGTALMAIIGLAAGVQGYYYSRLTAIERLLLFIVPFLLIVPNMITDAAGLVILTGVFLWQRRTARRDPERISEPGNIQS